MDDQITRRGPFDTGPISSEPGPIEAGERDPRYDNQPPLEERVAMEFSEELDREGITARVAELLASTARAPTTCDSDKIAGAMGDLCKQARNIEQRLEAVREKHNRPLLDARRALQARADSVIQPLSDAIAKIRQLLDDFTRAEEARRREEARRAEEARRIAEEAAAAALKEQGMDDQIEAVTPAPAPPPRVAAPIARGDYGSRVGARTVWHHEIESVRQIPDRYLKHPRVIKALDKVIAAEIRQTSGKCKIKGVRIWSDTAAAVR